MGFMGQAKGQLETNSTATALRMRCAVGDCQTAMGFKLQSMAQVQQELVEAGWVYAPGPDVGEGATMGYWRCGGCAAAQLTMDNGQLTTELAAPEAIKTGTQRR